MKTQIHMDGTMIEESKKLCEFFKPCGPLAVQLIQDKNTGDNYYIEIDPRYGGGAPLSMKAGARSAEALLTLLSGSAVEYQENSCNGAIYSRFDQSVCISEGDGTKQIKARFLTWMIRSTVKNSVSEAVIRRLASILKEKMLMKSCGAILNLENMQLMLT